VALHLIALLAMHALCWLAFFAHCRRALETAPQDTTVPIQQQQQSSTSHLVWLFAACNLACVLLVSWPERRHLRRACHLAGLAPAARLLGCCSSRAARPAGSGAAQIGGAGRAGAAQVEGSLFVVAGGRPLGQQCGGGGEAAAQRHLAAGLYATQAGLMQQQQQQHLYQQLATSQQHIYDSASNLHALDWPLQQYQQQQSQQQSQSQSQTQQAQPQPQHQSLTLNRNHLGQQLGPQLGGWALDERQQQHLATLARHSGQQQTDKLNRRQGEAEGPLVELWASSSSAASSAASTSSGPRAQPLGSTFGPQAAQVAQVSQMSQVSQAQQQQQQQQRAANATNATNATNQRPSVTGSQMDTVAANCAQANPLMAAQTSSIEHRLFSLQQQQRQQPINCHPLRAGLATSGAAELQRRQHALAEANSNSNANANAANFRPQSRAQMVAQAAAGGPIVGGPAGRALMMDGGANQGGGPKQQREQLHQRDLSAHQELQIAAANKQRHLQDNSCQLAGGNIYDVANYCIS